LAGCLGWEDPPGHKDLLVQGVLVVRLVSRVLQEEVDHQGLQARPDLLE